MYEITFGDLIAYSLWFTLHLVFRYLHQKKTHTYYMSKNILAHGTAAQRSSENKVRTKVYVAVSANVMSGAVAPVWKIMLQGQYEVESWHSTQLQSGHSQGTMGTEQLLDT